MSLLTICPCCSNTLLHHISHNREYWFCRNCWQEMPDLEAFKAQTFHRQTQISNLYYGFPKLKEIVAV